VLDAADDHIPGLLRLKRDYGRSHRLTPEHGMTDLLMLDTDAIASQL
jgi:hypothetical protein